MADNLTDEELAAAASKITALLLKVGHKAVQPLPEDQQSDILISALLTAVSSGIGFRFKQLDEELQSQYLDMVTTAFMDGIGAHAGITTTVTTLDDEKHAEAIAIMEKHGLGKTEH